jgi:ornithine cyclodeaminase/alanine dehydrogenase-like protein (mu-crystallin family)
MRLLTNADISSILTMKEGIAALRTGYDDLARGDAAFIPRIDLYAPTGREDDYYQWGSMAGACRSYGVVAVRIKSDIASWPQGRTQEKYCIEPGTYSGIILLYSISNGEPLALLQDGYLQHVRVGAAGGIGVELMAQPDADSLGLIGSGGMARTYLEAIAEVRTLREVRVYSTTPANCERFAAAAREELGLDVRAVGSAQEAVTDARIVHGHRLHDRDLRPRLALTRHARHDRDPPRALAGARRSGRPRRAARREHDPVRHTGPGHGMEGRRDGGVRLRAAARNAPASPPVTAGRPACSRP